MNEDKLEILQNLAYINNISYESFTEISEFINDFKISNGVNGYYYVQAVLIFMLSNQIIIKNPNKILYPTLAFIFKTTPSRVEKSIKHFIYIFLKLIIQMIKRKCIYIKFLEYT